MSSTQFEFNVEISAFCHVVPLASYSQYVHRPTANRLQYETLFLHRGYHILSRFCANLTSGPKDKRQLEVQIPHLLHGFAIAHSSVNVVDILVIVLPLY